MSLFYIAIIEMTTCSRNDTNQGLAHRRRCSGSPGNLCFWRHLRARAREGLRNRGSGGRTQQTAEASNSQHLRQPGLILDPSFHRIALWLEPAMSLLEYCPGQAQTSHSNR